MTDTSAPEVAALGILGGSFDPIHHGHLRLAEEAIEGLGLARVLLIPARPWQRPTAASAGQRLRMVELACAGNPRLHAEALELQRPGPSYTVETLKVLRERHGHATPLWLVLGADAFLRLPTWHAWTGLPALCNLAIVPRPGIDIAAHLPAELRDWWSRRSAARTTSAAGALTLLDAPQLEISATAIRAMVRAGRSPRYLLPDCVLDYIEFEGLYTQEGHGA
ncbi:MAG: nicotinate-nucleotide adenylyltransferase [Pseudomonadota bacterium]|nr:nicotinate-nucleotide adenylyltransferase [Pseudomonadota bacterium]